MIKINKFTIILTLIVVVMLLFSNITYSINLSIDENGLIVAQGATKADADDAWNQVLGSYRIFVLGFFAMATTTAVMLFIFSFIRLGASAGNSGDRAKAVSGIMWTGIATAFLGGTLLWFGVAYNLLR